MFGQGVIGIKVNFSMENVWVFLDYVSLCKYYLKRWMVDNFNLNVVYFCIYFCISKYLIYN